MSTAEVLVIGATGTSVLMYCWYRSRQQQRTLQWFYTRQSQQLAAQSEKIRDQLLQQAFALRRSVELCSIDVAKDTDKQLETSLRLSENFNQSLESLGDELSPPFLEDSLPLALQHLIRSWICNQPVELTLELPSDWPLQKSEQHRIVLWCVREFLMVLQSNVELTDTQALKLDLTQKNDTAKLQLCCASQISEFVNRVKLLSELNYIQQIFKLFMPGHCKVRYRESRIDCEFSWSLKSINTWSN
ncbi:MAG: hypothetical protein AAFW84_22095 [Cyanobacteria bacterium J06635_15]